MDPLFWLWLVALGLPVGLWLLRPLGKTEGDAVSDREQRLSALLAEKDAIMTALAELEMDYRSGRVPEADYREQRAALMERGAAVLKELEALQAEETEAASAPAAHLSAASPAEAPAPTATVEPRPTDGRDLEDDIEALLRTRRQVQQARYVGFCPSCGAALRVGHRFCPLCGAEVPSALRKKRTKARRRR